MAKEPGEPKEKSLEDFSVEELEEEMDKLLVEEAGLWDKRGPGDDEKRTAEIDGRIGEIDALLSDCDGRYNELTGRYYLSPNQNRHQKK